MPAFVQSLLGGVLIGVAAVVYLLVLGRVAGVSGVLGGLVAADSEDRGVRLAFLAGLVAGGIALRTFAPTALGGPIASVPVLVIAGVLVGVGTQLGNGCTSGHGVCGLGRRSTRSLFAVVVFMGVAMATVLVTRGSGG